ncbi:unnamed protein product, partial [Allacma fusca]
YSEKLQTSDLENIGL